MSLDDLLELGAGTYGGSIAKHDAGAGPPARLGITCSRRQYQSERGELENTVILCQAIFCRGGDTEIHHGPMRYLTTPLGAPVLPEVYITYAAFSGMAALAVF